MDEDRQAVLRAMELIPSLWVEKHKIRNESGFEIEFKDHNFMRDFYDDMSPLQVMLKAPQIGATVAELVKTFYCARKKKWDIIYCVDTLTEALTRKGFKKWDEIDLTDELLTLGLDGVTRWSKVKEVFSNDVTTTMYEYDTRNFNAFTTENHRWIVHDGKGGHEMTTSKNLAVRNRFIPKCVTNSVNDVKSLNDDYVRLLAWVFAEGNYARQVSRKTGKEKGWTIGITQSEKANSDKCSEIRRVLASNGIRWKEYQQTNYKTSGCIDFKFAFKQGKDIRTRFPDKTPDWSLANELTGGQARIFIETFVSADGWIDSSGTLAITQKSKKTVDILNMIAVLGGYSPSIVKPSVNGCYTVRLTQFPTVYAKELKPLIHNNWTGKIWCPRTDAGTFYARRNGRCYWTGNTLPTQGDVQDMAGGKINRIIAQNPVLMEWVRDHDTIEQKAVGENIIYYRGTFSNKQAMMVSSDLNVHDEVDASDASVITQYETRLQAKADGRRWYFSHPSLSGFGVDVYWQQSDKKEWFIKCNHCNKEQQLKWPDNIDMVKREYVCQLCHQPLTRQSRQYGRWVQTSSGIFSGYHVSQLMCPWITAEKICKDWDDSNSGVKDKQYFWNYVLGLPYVTSDDKIDPSIVLKNCVPEVNDQEDKIIIGVDTGLPIHYTILNKNGVFNYGKCKAPSPGYDPYDTIESFLKRWPKSIVVSDQGGDLIGIRKLQVKYPGRVFLVWYRRDRKSKEMIKWGKDTEFGTVTVDRNRMIQMIVEQMRDIGRIRLNGTVDEWTEFASHFGNIFRTVKPAEESHYGVEYIWDRNGPDHFVHTLLYGLVGLDRYASSMATIVGPTIYDEIPKGQVVDNSEFAL